MLLTCSEMRTLEGQAFADGITADALMEEAGASIALAVRQRFPTPGKSLAFVGKGHNGGDALVAARHLRALGWNIELHPSYPEESWAALTRTQQKRLARAEGTLATMAPAENRSPLIILDGLLGIGTGGILREPIKGACRQINQLRQSQGAFVFALDLPTGLDGDTGVVDSDAVMADVTLTIGCGKTGLIADEALDCVGRLAVLPLTDLSARMSRVPAGSTETLATAESLRSLLPPRPFGMHKGSAGRVAIFAGAVGTVGAAVMCASGALHGGAGLVHLYVPRSIYEIAATRAAPEIMVRPIDDPREIRDSAFDALAIGPGLGTAFASEVVHLIRSTEQPMVLDADALNIIAEDIHVLDDCAGPRLLTPHPGEMARLDPQSRQQSRRQTVATFTQSWPHTLLLKGSRTLIGQRGYPHSYNTTGHPGLASGGVGDVMSGLLAALTAQGLNLYDAARVGSWIIGRAAERAIHLGAESAESLSATRLFEHLGGAFKDLRDGVY